MWKRMLSGIARWPWTFTNWIRGRSHHDTSNDDSANWKPDVFLGGSCGKSTWREDIAVPHLMKHGISFFNPQRPEWSTRYISYEAVVKDSCRLLLYVITGDTRAITSLIEVGHYIGMGCNVVLCLQDIPQGAVIDGEELTEYAVKDYNRARTYLADLANRDGIVVIREDIPEALNAVVDNLKGKNCPGAAQR